MSRIIEAKAVISAQDATGSILDKISSKFKKLGADAKALDQIKPPRFIGDFNAELQRLKLTEKEMQGVRERRQAFMDALRRERPQAQHFFRAQNEWMDREVHHWRKLRAGIDEAATAHKRWRTTMVGAAGAVASRGMAMAGGAYAVARAGQAGIKAAAVGQRESARDYLAGMSPEESKRIEHEALLASGRFRSVDSSAMHERLRDTAMGMRSTDKALELTDTIGEMTTVLQSLKGKDKAIEEGRKFFAALDVMGKNIDPKEVRELADATVKALGVQGADMDIGGVLQFARQSRAAGGILSNRFLASTMPGLARDMGDAQLGTALASSLGQNIGDRATKEAKNAQTALGLRDAKGFKNARLAMSDPDRYAWEVLMPALQKKGVNVDDDLAVTQQIAKIFSNRTVQDVFSKLINQRQTYQGQAVQYERAPGLAAGRGELMTRDPFVAYEAVFAQLKTLASQAPIMNVAAREMNLFADGIARISKAVQSGNWLDALPEADRRVISAITEPASAVNARNELSALRGRLHEQEQKQKWSGVDEKTMGAIRLKAFELRSGIGMREGYAQRGEMFSPAEVQRWQEQSDEMARERNRGNYGGSSGTPLPPTNPNRTSFPPHGDDAGGMQNVQVEGEVKGEVQVELPKLVVDSTGLVTVVGEMKKAVADVMGRIRQLSINSNGPGSTGRSSPDAQAPGGTGFGGGGL